MKLLQTTPDQRRRLVYALSNSPEFVNALSKAEGTHSIVALDSLTDYIYEAPSHELIMLATSYGLTPYDLDWICSIRYIAFTKRQKSVFNGFVKYIAKFYKGKLAVAEIENAIDEREKDSTDKDYLPFRQQLQWNV